MAGKVSAASVCFFACVELKKIVHSFCCWIIVWFVGINLTCCSSKLADSALFGGWRCWRLVVQEAPDGWRGYILCCLLYQVPARSSMDESGWNRLKYLHCNEPV